MKIEYFHYFFINCYLIIFFNYLIISKVRPNTRPKNEKTNLEEFYFFITYFFKKKFEKKKRTKLINIIHSYFWDNIMKIFKLLKLMILMYIKIQLLILMKMFIF